MFVSKEVNERGAYAITLTKHGEKRTMIIDDTLPISGNEPAFCHERRGLLWVSLLNKAWAKLHGSYDSSRISCMHQAIRDLTGAPSFEWPIADTPELFNKFMEGLKKNYLMLVTIDIRNSEERASLKKLGVEDVYSLTIVDAAGFIDQDGNQIRVVKFKEPYCSADSKKILQTFSA